MELETLACNFRKAIEAAQANYEPGEFFRKFPTGQCGHTINMLVQYLIDNGIGPITYVRSMSWRLLGTSQTGAALDSLP